MARAVRSRKRSAVAVSGGMGAVMLAAWASAAFACTNLATISLSAGYGRVGDSITLIGTSFPVPAPNTRPTTPVVVHWASSTGPVLATMTPDRTGNISTTFMVPPSAPGDVVIVAVQRRSVGDPNNPSAPASLVDEAGTPARATFRVLASNELPPTTALFSQSVANSGNDGSTATIVLMVMFGAVALSLFAGGVIAFMYQVRSRMPAAQPWRHR